MRGILPGDMVLFGCHECDLDGPLRPTHVIECCPDEKKNEILKVVGRIETVADSQMRRGGESNSMYTITYRVRSPKHPMTQEEIDVNRRFVRQCTCFQPFCLETTPVLSALAPVFPNFISKKARQRLATKQPRKKVENIDNGTENNEYSSDDEEWVPTANLWIERTILVKAAYVEDKRTYQMKRFSRAIKNLSTGRLRLGWALFLSKIEKEKHSWLRWQMSIVLQSFWRARVSRQRAKKLFKQRVKLDRLEQRARLRIAQKARHEVKRRQAQRLRRAVGITLDGKWFHLNTRELNKFWHDREKGAVIMKKFVNKLRLEFLTLVFYHWYEVARMIIAELDRKNRPKTSLELMQEFEAEHKRDIDEVRQRVQELPPWHSALGIRMPLLQTADMIGAHTDINGKLQITHLERWRRFKDRMTGPTDNTHWLLQGALREDGTSMNARILLGGYPRGSARAGRGNEVKHGSAIEQLLIHGIDTFVCLSEWNKDDEKVIKQAHSSLRDEFRVQVESAKIRYKRATLGAEKAKDYAHEQRAAMISRKVDAGHSLKNCKITYNKLTKHVRFIQHYIDEKIGIPNNAEDERRFVQFLENLERRLRRRERLYIFSEHGHGRAGLVGACLVGRLYGMEVSDALELVQRTHDTRIDQTLTPDMVLGFPTAKWRGKGKSKRIAKEFSVGPRKNFVSCPRLARQRHFVRRLLTPMQTNFNPTQLRDDSGPLTHYMQSRKEIFMSTQKHKRNKLKEEREKKKCR